MIDFNFKDEITLSPFLSRNSRLNTYQYRNINDKGVLLLNPKFTPLIMLGNIPGINKEILPISDNILLKRYNITKIKVEDIINSSRAVLPVLINSFNMYAGKGILAKDDNVSLDPLLVYTVPEIDYADNNIADLTLLIKSNYNMQESPIVKSLILAHIKDHPGEIIITTDIFKYIRGKLKVPKFRSPAEKKTYTLQLIDQCVEIL